MVRIRTTLLLAAALYTGSRLSPAQSVAPIATLDLNRFLASSWFEIARLPVKREKQCTANQIVLYAPGDKDNTFQIVTECQIKTSETNWWDDNGQTPAHPSGALRLRRFVVFHPPYYVFALDPDFNWALVGTPNHRALWILSKTPSLPDGTLATLKSQAAAAGFNVSKLVTIPQHNQK